MVGQRRHYTRDQVRQALRYADDLRASRLGAKAGTFVMHLQRHKTTSLISRQSRLVLLLARSSGLLANVPREILLLIFEHGRASRDDLQQLTYARNELKFNTARKKEHDLLEHQVLMFRADPALLYHFLLIDKVN
jgi:hypothetical protein